MPAIIANDNAIAGWNGEFSQHADCLWNCTGLQASVRPAMMARSYNKQQTTGTASQKWRAMQGASVANLQSDELYFPEQEISSGKDIGKAHATS